MSILVSMDDMDTAMSDKTLTRILDRLDALELILQDRRASTQLAQLDDRKLSKHQVAFRDGRSMRSIDRDVKAGKFPPPDDIINGRLYWRLSTLQRHDRERQAHHPPARKPSGRKQRAHDEEAA
jgi:hypothetical protein